jgi:hypothetical protein
MRRLGVAGSVGLLLLVAGCASTGGGGGTLIAFNRLTQVPVTNCPNCQVSVIQLPSIDAPLRPDGSFELDLELLEREVATLSDPFVVFRVKAATGEVLYRSDRYDLTRVRGWLAQPPDLPVDIQLNRYDPDDPFAEEDEDFIPDEVPLTDG